MSIKEKLRALIEKLLQSSRIPKVYAPIISGMINKFLDDVTDEELTKHINALRLELIPWILGENDTNNRK